MRFTWNLPADAAIVRSILDPVGPNRKGGLVLCEWRSGMTTHVTWRVDMNGNPYSGHYFTSEAAALTDFRKRDLEIWG